MDDRHPTHIDSVTMEAAVTGDERSSSPPAAAARSRHLRTLMQSKASSESSYAVAASAAAAAPTSTATAEPEDAAPAPACWFIAPSGESIVSNKPFALELRLWLHQHSRSSQSDADAAASSSAAAASPSAAAPSAATAATSTSGRTLLLFPLAVKISARSVEKKTNVYQSLERVWVRAQREEQQHRDESSVSSAQPAEKDVSSKEPAAARHPRLAHHVKAVQNADHESADGDEDRSSGGSEDEERSSDRSSLQPPIRSAKAQTSAAATASSASPLSLPFLPPAITPTLKSPLSNKASNAKAAHRKGPLFKPLYLKKGALNKAAREEQRDRSIGTAAIRIKRPPDVKSKGAELSAAELISQLHVSYAPLQQREGDAGLLVHVLTKGGASEKRPKQKYILFQAGFAYSIELPELPPSFTLTLHSFRLRSWEQQLASLEVKTEEAVLPSFPSPSSKKRSRRAAASPAVRSNFKSKVEQDSGAEADRDEWLTDGEPPRIERKLPSRAAAPRPAIAANAASTRSAASAIAGTAKRNKPQGLLGSLPTRHGRSLSALLAAIEQDEKREAGAKESSAAALPAPAPAPAAAPRRRHLQRSSAAATVAARADDGCETDVSSVSRHSASEAAKAQGDVTTDLDLDSGWGTDDMQPTSKRQKIQPAIARAPAIISAAANLSDQTSAASAAPVINKKRHARRSLFSVIMKHRKQKHAATATGHDRPASKRVQSIPPSTPKRDPPQLAEVAAAVAAAAAAVTDPSLSSSNAASMSFAPLWMNSAWHLLPATAPPPFMTATHLQQPPQQQPNGFQTIPLPLGMSCGSMGSGGSQSAYAGAPLPSPPWHASSASSSSNNGVGTVDLAQSTGSLAAASLAAFSSRASSPATFTASAGASASSHAFLRPPSATIMPLTPASPFTGGRMEESSSPGSALPMALSAGGSPMSPLQLTPHACCHGSAPHSGSTSSGRCTPLPTSASVTAPAASGSPRSFLELSGANHNQSSRQQPHRHLHLPLSGRTGSVGLGSGAGLGFHAVHSPTQGQGRLGFQPRSLFLHPLSAQPSSRSASGTSGASGASHHMLLSPPMPLAALLSSYGSGRDLHSPAPQSTAATAGSLQSDAIATALELQPTRTKATAASADGSDGLPLALISSDESVASDGEESSEEDNLPPSHLQSQLSAPILHATTPATDAAPFSPAHVFYCASPNSRFDL